MSVLHDFCATLGKPRVHLILPVGNPLPPGTVKKVFDLRGKCELGSIRIARDLALFLVIKVFEAAVTCIQRHARVDRLQR